MIASLRMFLIVGLTAPYLFLHGGCSRAYAATFVVNSTSDESDVFPGDGVAEISPGSAITTLRAAIEEANAFPGPDTIYLGGSPANVTRALPPLSDMTGGTTVIGGGSTHPFEGEYPDRNIVPVSSGALLSGRTLDPNLGGYSEISGLRITSPNNVIDGVSIGDFPSDGIEIYGENATGNVIRACHIGLQSKTPIRNGRHGIHIHSGASGNLVGGALQNDRNIIGANEQDGIHIAGEGTDGNEVLNNFIGVELFSNFDDCILDALTYGTPPRDGCAPNFARQLCENYSFPNLRHNVYVNGGASRNIIGRPNAGNYVTGSIWVPPPGIPCNGPVIDPYCVVDPYVVPTSGPERIGVLLEGEGTDENEVAANIIGYRHYWILDQTDYGYTLTNGVYRSGQAKSSVVIRGGASENLIGGEGEAYANQIDHSLDEAILIEGGGTDGNRIVGNDIRGDDHGVTIRDGAMGNTIGSASGWGNEISARYHGVVIAGPGTSENLLIGNEVGSCGFSGVAVYGGAFNNRIGGSANGEGNQILANCSDGIIIYDPDTDGNQILGNTIANNGEIGVFMVNGASNNIIGGTTPGAGNSIYGNTVTGVEIHDVPSTGNRILGNKIYDNGTRGVLLVDGTSNNIIGGEAPAERNEIYGNNLSGIEINGPQTFENKIRLNSIHDNVGKGILISFEANRGIQPPEISSFVPFAGSAAPNSIVDVFSDGAEEGKHYIGTVQTDESGAFSASLSLNPFVNTFLTATATDADGNTSEFSAPVFIVPVTLTGVPADQYVVEGDTLSLEVEVEGSPEIHFQWRFRTAQGDYADLVESDFVRGVQSATLTIESMGEAWEGYYQCVADNGLGPALSREISIQVVELGLDELEIGSLHDALDGDTSSFVRLLASPGPDGEVSLREALAAANAMDGPNTIRFAAEGTIQLESPLPIIDDNTGGLTLDGGGRVALRGTALTASDAGLAVRSPANIIRGLKLFGFPGDGIVLSGEGATGNTVSGCVIGYEGDAPAIGGNGILIAEGAHDNLIGGVLPGEANHLAGNGNAGVSILGVGTSGNRLLGNWIGLNNAGVPLGGNLIAGVLIGEGATDNVIGADGTGEGNYIVGNAGIGVWVTGGMTRGNTIIGNTIFDNGDLGIRLHEGGNGGVARPEITSVSPLAGIAPPNSRVDCYIDGAEEGETFLVTLEAGPDGTFGASLDVTAYDGQYLTAISTDSQGNTSAFSRPAAIDFTAPVITLLGAAAFTHECGTAYDDPGAEASDNIDGNLNAAIEVAVEDTSGQPVESLDAAPPGEYLLRYSVTDSAGLAATPVTRSVTISDRVSPTVTLLGETVVELSCGAPFPDPGATAEDGCDGELETVVSGLLDTTTPGEYQLNYTATDAAGNTAVAVTRLVTVRDTAPPELTLRGASDLTVECGTTFTDPGATAFDACDGEVGVTVEGDVDMASPGVHILRYRAADASGNVSTVVERTVTVADTTPPVIVLAGEEETRLNCGEGYLERGAAVEDNCDVTASVTISGELDTGRFGVYTLFYDATDAAGNAAETVTRTIVVGGDTVPVITLTGNPQMTVACNGNYADPGATAVDGCLTDISDAIESVNPVNTAVPGVYTVTYQVTDGAGTPAAEVTRTVTVLPCAIPCDATCAGGSDDDVDLDGDGLSACKERCAGTSDSNVDFDGDGMSDGFEYRHQLDPKENDASLDLDADGFTNIEEYFENSSPRNPSVPANTFRVSPTGEDRPDAGTPDRPWQSLAYALERLQNAPAGRNQLLVESGVYAGGAEVPPGILVRGAPGADAEVVGELTLREGAGLRELTISADADDQVLLTMSGGGVSVVDCILDGAPRSGVTGVVAGAGGPAASFEGCLFIDLEVGLRVEATLPHLRNCVFTNIGGVGVLIEESAILSPEDVPGQGLSGWNDFTEIGDGLAIENRSAGAVGAGWNEWGSQSPDDLRGMVAGEVAQGNPLPEGGAAGAAALDVVVLNGKTQARFRNAAISLSGQGLVISGVTDSRGVATFSTLAAGTWNLSVRVPGFPDGSASVLLMEGTRHTRSIAMLPEENVEEPGGSGCAGGAKVAGAIQRNRADVLLAGLLVASLLVVSRWRPERHGQ